MPLQHAAVGSKGFGENIKKEVEAGKPQKQAVAIAYKMSGEKQDASNGDPADITRLSERCDAIADSLREVGRRLDASLSELMARRPKNEIDLTRMAAEFRKKGLSKDQVDQMIAEARRNIAKRDAAAGSEAGGKKLDALPSGWRISTGKDGKFYLWRGTTPVTKNGKGFDSRAEAEAHAATFKRDAERQDDWSPEARKAAAEARKKGASLSELMAQRPKNEIQLTQIAKEFKKKGLSKDEIDHMIKTARGNMMARQK